MKPHTKRIIYLFKVLIFFGILSYLIWELYKEKATIGDYLPLIMHKSGLMFYLLISVVVVFINWGIEAIKWQYLLKSHVKISFLSALRAVLTGLSFSMVTPDTVADYFGRSYHVKIKGRSRLLVPVILNRISLFVVTMVFGLAGISIYLLNNVQMPDWIFLFIACLCVILIVSVVLYTSKSKWLIPLEKHIQISFFKRIWTSIRAIDKRIPLVLLTWSTLRYCSFILQFCIMYHLLDYSGSWLLLMAGVSLIFAAKSIWVSFNAAFDLGVREAAGVLFIGMIGVDSTLIIVAGLLVWLMNVLLPAIIGSFFILSLKIKWQSQ